jgi:hypothetical protein
LRRGAWQQEKERPLPNSCASSGLQLLCASAGTQVAGKRRRAGNGRKHVTQAKLTQAIVVRAAQRYHFGCVAGIGKHVHARCRAWPATAATSKLHVGKPHLGTPHVGNTR